MTWSILIRCNIITDNHENKEFFKVSIFLKVIYSKVLRVILHYFTRISARPQVEHIEKKIYPQNNAYILIEENSSDEEIDYDELD